MLCRLLRATLPALAGATLVSAIGCSAPTEVEPEPEEQFAIIEVQNQLIYPITTSTTSGSVTVEAQSIGQLVVPVAAQVMVEWELVRPTLSGRPLGDPMAGVFAVSATRGTHRMTVNNLVGGTYYFAPIVTNTTNVGLLMTVNHQLQSETRCNCVVGVAQFRVAFGYYRLFTNSNVTAFRDGSNYSGSYSYFRDFGATIPVGSGARDFTFSVSP